MTPRELLDAGRLTDAVDALTQEVKARPADTQRRTFLFELLCLAGDLDRAGKQLDALGRSDNVDGALAVQIYRNLIAAERTRRDVFHNGALPKFLLPPPAYADHYVVLVKKLAQSSGDAVNLLATAEEGAPAISGHNGEKAFSRFRDADDRVASVLEVFHGDTYVWLPLDQVRRVQVTPPKNLRDTVWPHATIETHDGSVGDVFLPALYVDSHRHANDQVRLGRMTEWNAVEDQLICGSGQRVFLIDDEEVSLLDVRDAEFAAPVAEAGRS